MDSLVRTLYENLEYVDMVDNGSWIELHVRSTCEEPVDLGPGARRRRCGRGRSDGSRI